MTILVPNGRRWEDWAALSPNPVPYFLRRPADANGQCPWCGCPEQYTDWRGHCCGCRLPWNSCDWLPFDFDEAEKRLEERVHSAFNQRIHETPTGRQ
jgi:hypothetical protein